MQFLTLEKSPLGNLFMEMDLVRWSCYTHKSNGIFFIFGPVSKWMDCGPLMLMVLRKIKTLTRLLKFSSESAGRMFWSSTLLLCQLSSPTGADSEFCSVGHPGVCVCGGGGLTCLNFLGHCPCGKSETCCSVVNHHLELRELWQNMGRHFHCHQVFLPYTHFSVIALNCHKWVQFCNIRLFRENKLSWPAFGECGRMRKTRSRGTCRLPHCKFSLFLHSQ